MMNSQQWKIFIFNQPMRQPRTRNWPGGNFETEKWRIHDNIFIGFQAFVHGGEVPQHGL
jgi:carbonic anhydrase/acetyltransferase-like protein (isoleucine patch superfamily)